MAAYRRVDDLRSPAGWLPVHRDQLRPQRSVSSMGSLYLLITSPDFRLCQPLYHRELGRSSANVPVRVQEKPIHNSFGHCCPSQHCKCFSSCEFPCDLELRPVTLTFKLDLDGSGWTTMPNSYVIGYFVQKWSCRGTALPVLLKGQSL